MHEQYLRAALEQAWLGRGMCAPNPSVGAVAVQNNKIIAQAWHRGAGTPHAEHLLLEMLPLDCTDVTLYVTLEPCNHWGRTPPCVDAIIRHRIKRVVFAYQDPNRLVASNNTPQLLMNAGIEVIHLSLPEIDHFYQSYHYWTRTKKPWVTAKIAQTFDGKIAGPHGERVILSNKKCSEFTHEQRLHSDIILTTSRTINLDDPKLNARFANAEYAKPVAILDRQLQLNPNAKLFNTAQNCLVYYNSASAQLLEEDNNEQITYQDVPLVSNQLDLEAILVDLGARGYHDVWVEAGGVLFNALHKAGLVNRTHIYLVPHLLGQEAVSAYQDSFLFQKTHQVHWQIMDDNVIATFDW